MPKNSATILYQQLRALSWEELWAREVVAFEQTEGAERARRAPLLRAMAVLAAGRSAPDQQKAVAWLRPWVGDAEEKVRRYALAALTKLEEVSAPENLLLSAIENSRTEREKRHATNLLTPRAGAASLAAVASVAALSGGPSPLRQRALSNVARDSSPGKINAQVRLPVCFPLHLRTRPGLESVLVDEIASHPEWRVQILRTEPGLVVLALREGISWAELFRLRCFSTAAFSLGVLAEAAPSAVADLLAKAELADHLQTLTEGPVRYRLEFIDRGHQRALIRNIAEEIFRRLPALLNDSRQALWQVDIYDGEEGAGLEVRPRWSPDPRFSYRVADQPASSHPPLAAALARLAAFPSTPSLPLRVWDPFCGCGTELIEYLLLHPTAQAIGTDLSAAALQAARENGGVALRGKKTPAPVWLQMDFRQVASCRHLDHGQLSAIVTNPPMGKRVPVPQLDQLIAELFALAGRLLAPGGTLVVANPCPFVTPAASSKLHQTLDLDLDLGGVPARLQKYIKAS